MQLRYLYKKFILRLINTHKIIEKGLIKPVDYTSISLFGQYLMRFSGCRYNFEKFVKMLKVLSALCKSATRTNCNVSMCLCKREFLSLTKKLHIYCTFLHFKKYPNKLYRESSLV